jgi:hypothetical protein
MHCPFKDCQQPPCQIAIHPEKHHIEYCRVCEEWRYLSDVGDDFPNMFWAFVAIAISMIVFLTLLNEHGQQRLFDNQPSGVSYSERLWGGSGGVGE